MAATNNKAKTNKVKTPYIKASIDRLTDGNTGLKAYASATIGGSFVITGIKVCDGKNGLFAQMPTRSYTDKNGKVQYPETFYPITAQARENLNKAVVNAYENEISQAQDDGEDFEEIADEDEGLSPSM